MIVPPFYEYAPWPTVAAAHALYEQAAAAYQATLVPAPWSREQAEAILAALAHVEAMAALVHRTLADSLLIMWVAPRRPA